MARSFYSSLYSSEGSSDSERILDKVSAFVSDDMNEKLTVAISDAEIEKALFQMGPTKSPGPDGLPALFSQRHWAVLKPAVCNAVWGFLAGTDCPADFHDTILVLIPKVNAPREFEPI
jgi:hypothetical protein